MSIAVQDVPQVKLLTDVLCLCISAGRAATQLPDESRRAVVEPLVQKNLQAGTLDLEPIWQALLREPNVTERALASTFAVMDDLQKALGVTVKPLSRLSRLNDAQRQRLLSECPVNRVEVEKLARRARIEAQLAPMKVSRPGAATSSKPALGGAESQPGAPQSGGSPAAPLSGASSSPVSSPSSSPGVGLVSSPGSALGRPTSNPPGSGPRLSPGSGVGLTQALSLVPTGIGGAPETGVGADDAAAREARVKEARALLSQANAEMMADAKRSRPGGAMSSQPRVNGKATVPSRGDRPKKEPKRSRPLVAALVGLVGLGLIAVTAYFTVYMQLPHDLDLATLTALQLSEAKQTDDGVQGTIADARWKGMGYDARRAAVAELFKQLKPRGVRTLLLMDAQRVVEAQVSDDVGEGAGKDGLMVLLPSTPPPGAKPPPTKPPPPGPPPPPPGPSRPTGKR